MVRPLDGLSSIFTANLMGIAWTVSVRIKHLLFSWLSYVWPWMKVKVNIINSVKCDSFCLTGFWDMVGDGKTHTHTQIRFCFYVKIYIKTLKDPKMLDIMLFATKGWEEGRAKGRHGICNTLKLPSRAITWISVYNKQQYNVNVTSWQNFVYTGEKRVLLIISSNWSILHHQLIIIIIIIIKELISIYGTKSWMTQFKTHSLSHPQTLAEYTSNNMPTDPHRRGQTKTKQERGQIYIYIYVRKYVLRFDLYMDKVGVWQRDGESLFQEKNQNQRMKKSQQ